MCDCYHHYENTEILNNCIEIIYRFISNPIIGYFIGFGIAIFLIYLQFSKSIANVRVNKVFKAINDFILEKEEQLKGKPDNRVLAMLRNSNRFSLGVTIDRITSSFDSQGVNIRDGFIPNFIYYMTEEVKNENGELKTKEKGDRWEFYFGHIEPVLKDLNQYAFLGWFRIGRIKKLNQIINLCYKLQAIVEIHDAIMDKPEAKEGIKFENSNREYFKIIYQQDTLSNHWLEKLENAYKELANAWRDILKLV